MKQLRTGLLLLAAVVLTAGSLALAQDSLITVQHDARLGDYLATAEGLALYVFSDDAEGMSTCFELCAENWPPLLLGDADLAALAEAVPGDFGTTDRADGGTQVTYNDQPLYTFALDAIPGDTGGHGIAGTWWLANVNPVVLMYEVGELGPILTGPLQMTLYVNANDTAGASSCTGDCAVNWPPLLGGFSAEGTQPLAGAGVRGELGIIERADGTTQVTYDGKPLYYFSQDQAPGDIGGQGLMDGAWQVAIP